VIEASSFSTPIREFPQIRIGGIRPVVLPSLRGFAGDIPLSVSRPAERGDILTIFLQSFDRALTTGIRHPAMLLA